MVNRCPKAAMPVTQTRRASRHVPTRWWTLGTAYTPMTDRSAKPLPSTLPAPQGRVHRPWDQPATSTHRFKSLVQRSLTRLPAVGLGHEPTAASPARHKVLTTLPRLQSPPLGRVSPQTPITSPSSAFEPSSSILRPAQIPRVFFRCTMVNLSVAARSRAPRALRISE